MDALVKQSCKCKLQFLSTTSRLNSQKNSEKPFSHHQSKLPRLPLPSLRDSMQRYLQSLKPILTRVEHETTQKIVSEFSRSKGVGETLTTKLQDRVRTNQNWLADLWQDHAYLGSRLPVPIYSNPGLTLESLNFSGLQEQLRLATRVIMAAVEFNNLIRSQQLSVEYSAGRRLCMAQYFNMFSSCRIPKIGKDSTYKIDLDQSQQKHIVVVHNNQFFAVDVLGEGALLPYNTILLQLQKVVQQSPKPVEELGILTTEYRDTWAKAYTELKKDEQNSTNLDVIHSALFVMCLDQPSPIYNIDNDNAIIDKLRTVTSRSALHGDGTDYNSANRWFDKILQLIINPSGLIAACYEHSIAEGPAIARLLDYIYEKCSDIRADDSGNDFGHNSYNESSYEPRILSWNLNSTLKENIVTAKAKFNKIVNDIHLISSNFSHFGTELIRSYRLSPDAFFQLAMQLAYHRLHGISPVTYETGGTRQYLLGRTDIIRSTTIESDLFVKAMNSAKNSKSEQFRLMLAALRKHKELTIEAISGYGWDRHLLGMKLMAKELGLNIPKLYLDVGYQRIAHITLSTSQVPSKHQISLSFGPTSDDCYGVCYSPTTKSYIFNCTTFKSCKTTDCHSFVRLIHSSLMDMQHLLLTQAHI